MSAVILDAEYLRRKARAQAMQASLHALKGQLGGADFAAGFTASAGSRRPSCYEELRERYATGRLTLGEFEAEVTVMLRGA